jgi:hypothetical protein
MCMMFCGLLPYFHFSRSSRFFAPICQVPHSFLPLLICLYVFAAVLTPDVDCVTPSVAGFSSEETAAWIPDGRETR